mgnify:CR=1 FL=1
MVVDAAMSPDPAVISEKVSGTGIESGRRATVVRLGSEPPSALRRSIMYWYSIESLPSLTYGGCSACAPNR